MSQVKQKTGSIDHKIPQQGALSISVTIGNAQIGGSRLYKENELIIKGEIQNFALGDCRDLADKTFTLYCNVLDVNTSTNRTSIFLEFNLGIDKYTYLFDEAAAENGLVQYKIDVKLIQL